MLSPFLRYRLPPPLPYLPWIQSPPQMGGGIPPPPPTSFLLENLKECEEENSSLNIKTKMLRLEFFASFKGMSLYF